VTGVSALLAAVTYEGLQTARGLSFVRARGPLDPSILLLLASVVAAAIALVRVGRQPNRRQGRRLAGVTLGGTVASLVVLLVVVPSAMRVRSILSWMGCAGNVTMLASALAMYASDAGAYPPADTWCDAIGEYASAPWAFICPERPDLRCGYAFNSALAGLKPGDVKSGINAVIVFESDEGWNASGGIELLPNMPRHRGSDIYGFTEAQVTSHFERAAQVSRRAVEDGTSGIFWDPTAAAEAGSHLPANE
jgi:hypothetical protein